MLIFYDQVWIAGDFSCGGVGHFFSNPKADPAKA